MSFASFDLLQLIALRNSEADDYTLSGDESSTLRVLLISRVIVGNPHKRRQNSTGLTEPPPGYHSVYSVFLSLLTAF
jgi:hypothetical protein